MPAAQAQRQLHFPKGLCFFLGLTHRKQRFKGALGRWANMLCGHISPGCG